MKVSLVESAKKIDISVVVPLYNEEGNTAKLHKEIVTVLKKITDQYEIIFVNDHSRDGTLSELKTLHPVTIIDLGRNTGQSAALKAGFDYASGEIIISMDGDGQNDPADIPRLLAELNKGYDCISGWRKNRKDKSRYKIVSRIGVKLHHWIIDDGVHDSGCTLKVYKKWIVKDLELFGELHRYLPALLKMRGAKVGELVVNHRARTVGKSKYNMLKVFKGFSDLWMVWFWQKYISRPAHFFTFLAFITMFFSFTTGFMAIYMKLANGTDLSNTFLPVVAVFSFMVAIQFFVTGILADISVKNYYKTSKPYFVREIIERK